MMLNMDNQLSKENDCIENIIKEEKLIEELYNKRSK